jgi:hypothetical protein
MGVGIGIVLLAVGLVLALAVGGEAAGVDFVLIGWILTGVGALAIIIALIVTAQRSHQTIEHVTRTESGGTGTTGTTGSGGNAGSTGAGGPGASA